MSRRVEEAGRGVEQKGPLGAHPAGCFITPGPCSAPGNSYLEGLPEASGPRPGPVPHGVGLARPHAPQPSAVLSLQGQRTEAWAETDRGPAALPKAAAPSPAPSALSTRLAPPRPSPKPPPFITAR